MTKNKYHLDCYKKEIQSHKDMGRKIVFTNGCFDILHVGHIRYLSQAKDCGDILVIGINSDNSIKGLKGPSRPINILQDRALILSAFKFVDYVISFEEQTPIKLIKIIMPDVLVKGGDYSIENIVGAKEVTNAGGRVELLKFHRGYSSSNYIDKIKKP